MLRKNKYFVLLYVIFILAFSTVEAKNRYDTELLKRQLKHYSLEKASEHIRKGDYKTAAKHILSLYPVYRKESVYLALSLAGKVNKDLPDFLFGVYQKIAFDETIILKADGKSLLDKVGVVQKAKWSDELIVETINYKKLKEHFKGDEKSANEFFFSAYHVYYMLDMKRASKFVEKFNTNSVTYRVLKKFAEASSGAPVEIKEIEKIDITKLSKSLKEMLVTLKGSYYMDKGAYQKAKEEYLEFFELEYSLPVHIENLATCYIADGSYDKAKPLLLYLSHLIQVDNISTDGIYNLACIFAREGDKDEAIRYLQESIKRGVPKSEAKDDDDLKSLRGDVRFIELVK